MTWAETQPAGAADKYWRTCGVSSDGSTMLAGVSNGRLYLYSGGSWAETQPAGAADKNWRTCGVSGDGSKMLAGVYGGRLYLYTSGHPAIWSHSIHGLTNANIGSIHGVEKSNIKSVFGV